MITATLTADEQLRRIADQPIVSTDTLRADHLCSALLAEAERLGVTLDRDLWQPATAIAAHGAYGGTMLDLPPRLEDISCDIVSELFDELNWAAPSGCSLGASEGDGACFLWTMSLEAQVEAINSNPKGKFEAKTLEIPQHWISALINGDESSFDFYLDDADYNAYEAFCDDELGEGWGIASCDGEAGFSSHHDASPYGVLACDTVECIAMRQRH